MCIRDRSITDRDFRHASRQRTLVSATHTTFEIYRAACLIFEDLWDLSLIHI